MSKAVLMSMIPKQCELVASGKQTVVVRKTKQKLETPFKVYIYCTKPKNYYRVSGCLTASDECLWLSNGKVKIGDGFEYWAGNKDYCNLNRKVIGEFVCDKVYFRNCDLHDFDTISLEELSELSCVSEDNLLKYADRGNLYGWHISNLVIYDKPKELSEFFHYCGDEPKCKGCPYLYTESDESVGVYAQCCSKEEGCKPLTRPPQSWCYVEELN